MYIPDNATPEELIGYAEYLAGGEYGEKKILRFGESIIFLHSDNSAPDGLTLSSREVCGYATYILTIGLSNFPGNSEKDKNTPKEITPQTIGYFKKRTQYLLPK